MKVYEVGPFQINAERLSLTCGGRSVALGRKAVETLLALTERPGEALAKDALLDRIWSEGFVEEANLTQNIYVLRKTFRAYGAPDPIETLPRYGYRLRAAVRLVGDVPAHRPHRGVAAGFAVAALVAVCLTLTATSTSGSRGEMPRLSENGARLYQIGRYYWNLRTPEGVQKSLNYFSQVVDADPRAPRGYAALADANITMGDYCYGTHRPAMYFARAARYAKEALALDPSSADAHAAVGFLALRRNDGVLAVTELQRAIALDPSYAPAHEWYGIALLTTRRYSQALSQLKIASDLDPLSVATTAWLGSAAYVTGRFDEAVAYSRQALELTPARADALITIGEAYEAKGKFQPAVDAFSRLARLHPYYRPEAAALLAHAYASERRVPRARAEFAYARAHASEVNPVDFAFAAAAAGERDVAVAALGVGQHGTALENAARVNRVI